MASSVTEPEPEITHGQNAGSPARAGTTAVPEEWHQLWGSPDLDPVPIEWHQLRRASHELASEIEQDLLPAEFGAAVGSEHLRNRPIHRWFTYKEGFSPDLLGLVIRHFELASDLRVADPFGGIATTALSGLVHSCVGEVRSVEYSPFARFVGDTKLLWPSFDLACLEEILPRALDYDRHRDVVIPDLAAFSNEKIFSRPRIKTLLAARDHVAELDDVDQPEKDFLLLGLAAVLEDLSGAMKDGRALRIKGARSRRASSLASSESSLSATGVVKRAIAGQWSGMLADLRSSGLEARAQALATPAHHLPGDARQLGSVLLPDGDKAFPDDWANLSLFSPPYLNCIDYTELYKLELWFLGHIKDQESFRRTRLGTLRSHPSVRFKDRDYFAGATGPAVELVKGLASWVSERGARPEVGPVILHYFEDMLQVWRQQHRLLGSGGIAVCVVANSTFSRRTKTETGERQEKWRLPILTDVILGHLADIAGFKSVKIWHARDLRPRNVRGGSARESLVVARKA